MVWGAIIGGGLAAAGTYFGAQQQGYYSRGSQMRQQAFQREMSDTAYQRAAKDLDKAGLNRILALGQPASSPAGAAAAIDQPDYGKSLPAGVQTASAIQAIDQSKAQENLLKEQTRLTGAEASKAEVTRMLYEKLGPHAEELADQLINRFTTSAEKGGTSPAKMVSDLLNDPQKRSGVMSGVKDAIIDRYRKVGEDTLENIKRTGKYLNQVGKKVKKKAVEYRPY